MKHTLTAILTIVLCLSSACGSHSADIPDRPSGETPTSPELDDDAMRISGEALTMNYDDAGILFSITNDGVISAIRLADDTRFEFDPAKPSLTVNGSAIRLKSSEIAKQTDDCRWYRLVTSDRGKEIYIVINKL